MEKYLITKMIIHLQIQIPKNKTWNKTILLLLDKIIEECLALPFLRDRLLHKVPIPKYEVKAVGNPDFEQNNFIL